MRERDFKLIRFFEDGHEDLYNLRTDIAEKEELSAREPAIAKRLSQCLTEWLKETGAQLPKQNPDYDPTREREPGTPMGPVPK